MMSQKSSIERYLNRQSVVHRQEVKHKSTAILKKETAYLIEGKGNAQGKNGSVTD